MVRDERRDELGPLDPRLDLDDAELAELRIEPGADLGLLCILVVPQDVRAMTVNLKAPLVVNRTGRLAKQVILSDERYSLRAPVLREMLATASAG